MNTLLKGGCLCGAIQYEIAGEASAFYHCHCKRCRKLSGTGHASNVRVSEGTIRWLQGETLLGSFKVPEAKRFRNDFCTRCGSPLPRAYRDMGIIVVPAGSLDDDPPLAPQAHIFMDSAAAWSCQDDTLPKHPEYVGK